MEIIDSSGLRSITQYVKPSFKLLKYFGDCKNIVDIDQMWNATQMANVLVFSFVIKLKDLKEAGIKFKNGQRKLLQKLKSWFKHNEKKLDDENSVVCGVNEQQHIFFIYVTDLDMHFFFDVY